MKRLTAWLEAEHARVDNAPRLEDALLGSGRARYAGYRMRYTFVRALIRTALRITELVLFASVVPFEMLGVVLVTRSSMLLSESLWWGSLEPLRDDVGRLIARGRTGQASLRIRQWVVLSLALGLAAFAFTALFVAFAPSRYGSLSVIDVYLLGSALRWATDLWSTTYHAGIYGVRRVYRPLWSLLVPELAEVLVMGFAFWWLGGFGLGTALVLIGGLRAAISWTFTRRVYAQLKLALGGPGAWLTAWRKAVWSPRQSARFAIGNAVAEVDALLVASLIAMPGNPESTLMLAALFHVLAPLQAAASSWPRPFYFDFKRLRGWGSPELLRRFETFLDQVLWWVPVPIGAVTLILMLGFWRGDPGWLSFELFCLTAIRARLALVHVRAYALGDHRYLLRLLFVMLSVATVGSVAAVLEAHVALGLVTAAAAAGLLLVGRGAPSLATERPKGALGPSVWVHWLLRESGPVCVGLARIDRRLTTLGRVERAWGEVLGDAVFTRLSHDTLVWFGHGVASPERLSSLSGGTLRALQQTVVCESGLVALRTGLPDSAWQRHFRGVVSEPVPTVASPEERRLTALQRDLTKHHPEFVVHPLDASSVLPQVPATQQRELRRVILDAARGQAGVRTLGALDVAVFAPCGSPVALLTAPVSSRRSRPSWRSEVALLIERAEIAEALSAHSRRARNSD